MVQKEGNIVSKVQRWGAGSWQRGEVTEQTERLGTVFTPDKSVPSSDPANVLRPQLKQTRIISGAAVGLGSMGWGWGWGGCRLCFLTRRLLSSHTKIISRVHENIVRRQANITQPAGLHLRRDQQKQILRTPCTKPLITATTLYPLGGPCNNTISRLTISRELSSCILLTGKKNRAPAPKVFARYPQLIYPDEKAQQHIPSLVHEGHTAPTKKFHPFPD